MFMHMYVFIVCIFTCYCLCCRLEYISTSGVWVSRMYGVDIANIIIHVL